MAMVKNFFGAINDKTIYDFSRALNYRLDKPEERIELINRLIYNEDGNLDKYFEEVFTQKFDLKSENLYEDMEDVEVDMDKLTFTGANVSNVKLILSKEDNLYSETNIAKELEKMANYIIFSGEKEKKTEYKIYKDEQLFHRMLKETSFGDGSSEEIENTIHMLIEKNQNFKLEAKQKIFKEDIDVIPIIKEYSIMLDMISFKLRKIAMLEKFYSKTNGFTNLDEITYEDECYIHEFGLDIKQITKEHYKEAQRQKALLQKHSALIKQDMLDIKDDILGTIYFKQPLSDSTEIDYEQLDWKNEAHIKALLRIPPKGNDLQEDMVCILYDLENILKKINLSNKDKEILRMYRQGLSFEEIGNIEQMVKSGAKDYIDRIAKRVVKKYCEEYEDWYYREVEKGSYKTCKACGQAKLATTTNFSKDAKGKMGLRAKCKECS